MSDFDNEQEVAAEAAVELVEDGMVVGLGTGSTAAHAIRALGRRVSAGLKITGIPTSIRSDKLARELGITIVDLQTVGQIDLTIDGADEFDPQLRLTKGGGGALLREKIVAFCSKRVAIIADSHKRVPVLGKFPLPCEVLPFAAVALRVWMEQTFSVPVTIRETDGRATVTDQGNYLLDCHFGSIADPEGLAARLEKVPGILGHGLFLGVCDYVYVAKGGNAEVLRAPADR